MASQLYMLQLELKNCTIQMYGSLQCNVSICCLILVLFVSPKIVKVLNMYPSVIEANLISLNVCMLQ